MSATTPERRAYRPAEFADTTGTTRAFVYKLIQCGELRTVKLGRCTLIPASELDRILGGGEAK
jgi:excisionase family DNA binding protein